MEEFMERLINCGFSNICAAQICMDYMSRRDYEGLKEYVALSEKFAAHRDNAV